MLVTLVSAEEHCIFSHADGEGQATAEELHHVPACSLLKFSAFLQSWPRRKLRTADEPWCYGGSWDVHFCAELCHFTRWSLAKPY